MTDQNPARFLTVHGSTLDQARNAGWDFVNDPPTPDRQWHVLTVISQLQQAIADDGRASRWFDDLTAATNQLTDTNHIGSYRDSDGLAMLRSWLERYDELVVAVSPLRHLLGQLIAEHTQDGLGRVSNHWRGRDFADGYDAGIEFAVNQITALLDSHEDPTARM